MPEVKSAYLFGQYIHVTMNAGRSGHRLVKGNIYPNRELQMQK